MNHTDAAPAVPPLLELRGVSKQYPGIRALNRVSLSVMPGEVHILFGENGAGKSTLISLIAGAQQASEGEIRLDGTPVSYASVRDARRMGISTVFQEFSLVPTMTVAENLFLGDDVGRLGYLNRRAQQRRAASILDELGFDLDARVLVSQLSRAEQQMVEIAKALHAKARLLILDEPTASLSDRETDRLFELIGRLKAQRVSIIYITHRMQEIRRIGDRISVLRDGNCVGTFDAQAVPEGELISLMAGRAVGEIFPEIAYRPAATLLEVKDLSTASGVTSASLVVQRGEVVGIAGLVGCGKSELVRAVFGVETITSGSVVFRGSTVVRPTPSRMLARGLFYLPSDRRAEGLVMSFTSQNNMTLPALRGIQLRSRFGWLSTRRKRHTANALAERVGLNARNVNRSVGLLSGGNQQKVVFAKGLVEPRELFIFDEPTVGVDVGTRSTLYALIKRLVDDGAGVVIVSSDLPEVLHLSHRLYVMRAGRIVSELESQHATQDEVLSHFFERSEATEATLS
ncbi:sugar ABC transporter ATP-binding protein [Paraburkholderia sp. J41]|uniref:sugar ABC transporter ATP-binding protein n=1 Tax=Paraburkholderia sp. J41 TaxID=2805433 RepID=UPI002AC36E24|nr:sugar ABC transporter ATP-binding protein [Paraburkholderia sp. J41]